MGAEGLESRSVWIQVQWEATDDVSYDRTSQGHRPAARRGNGLIVFASVLLVILGCFNLIYGIAAIANSHVFTANAHYVFSDLRTWGWITLIIGVLQLLAAAGVVAENQLARWFAVAVIGLGTESQGERVRRSVLADRQQRLGFVRRLRLLERDQVRVRRPQPARRGAPVTGREVPEGAGRCRNRRSR